jgi:hypothetical protein
MLLEAANRTTGLLKQPIPFVMQTALSDFGSVANSEMVKNPMGFHPIQD